MTLASPIITDVTDEARWLEAMRSDRARTFKQCGPHIFTPHPTHGVRIFVIAPESTVFSRDMCSTRGKVQRSALREKLTEGQVRRLLSKLREGKYQIKLHESALDGSWISYQIEYSAYDELS